MNGDLEATWAYHDGTKHSARSVRANPHYLDRKNLPLPFKIYTTLKPIPLPRDVSESDHPALKAISSIGTHLNAGCPLEVSVLSQLLFFSAGITRRREHGGREILFRAASCTGALYHIDLYVICGDMPGLAAGVYQFSVHDFALRRLRSGDFRGEVVRATAGDPSMAEATAIIASASTYWRNAWKYQARMYRHCFWDNGTILANMLAMAEAHEVPAQLLVGFEDAALSRLLGLDELREGAHSLVALGRDRPAPSPPPPAVEPLNLETEPLSEAEVDYPAIRSMHVASSLTDGEEVATWRDGRAPASLPAPAGKAFPLQPLADAEEPTDPIGQVIRRRGSTREFALEPITFAQLSTILRAATRGIPADFLDPPGSTLNDLYLIVNAVEGLPSGAYVFHREQEALELLKEGEFRGAAGVLGLEQALPAAASVDVFFLADLERVLQQFGNRGYRAAQLEAGIIGGKLYLAAYAQRLGASGLTFYDDDVTEFFSPHAKGKSVMFLVALGRSAKRKRGAS